MNLFSEIIAHFKGLTVRTHIIHKIYGNQKLTIRNFQPICTEDKVGFVINGHENFMYLDEIEDFSFEKNFLKINGILQKMIIEII